ncbi:MAG: T9SS type A sorting domain-containing protein [Candidatus Cloacimonadaceae bacterium]|nr:T9SS type A sorting domain-containing protein [Candidatus Cloacimonadaceae bacterium]
MKQAYFIGTLGILMALSTMALSAQSQWQSVTGANVTLEYRITQGGQNLECRLTGQTTGWVAVGFNPTTVMRNANIIIGYVSGANTSIRDDWGTSNTSHVSDISLGGTSDVALISGNESAGNTILQFTIPLVTIDQYDRPLVAGQVYPILLARGANNADNFTGAHADASTVQINLIAPVSSDDPYIGGITRDRILSIYPNPFSETATIKYRLAENSVINLSVYNQRGQLVHRISGWKSMGDHDLVWNPGNLPEGVYMVRLQSGKGITTQRITALRR